MTNTHWLEMIRRVVDFARVDDVEVIEADALRWPFREGPTDLVYRFSVGGSSAFLTVREDETGTHVTASWPLTMCHDSDRSREFAKVVNVVASVQAQVEAALGDRLARHAVL